MSNSKAGKILSELYPDNYPLASSEEEYNLAKSTGESSKNADGVDLYKLGGYFFYKYQEGQTIAYKKMKSDASYQ